MSECSVDSGYWTRRLCSYESPPQRKAEKLWCRNSYNPELGNSRINKPRQPKPDPSWKCDVSTCYGDKSCAKCRRTYLILTMYNVKCCFVGNEWPFAMQWKCWRCISVLTVLLAFVFFSYWAGSKVSENQKTRAKACADHRERLW